MLNAELKTLGWQGIHFLPSAFASACFMSLRAR